MSLLVLSGCGPSLRRVEQANAYFERCHAADRDPRRTDEERRACWLAWREHYTVGQPPDRIDYVRERLLWLDPTRAEPVALATAGFVHGEVAEADTPGAPAVGSPEPSSEPSPRDVTERSATSGRASARARRRPIPPRTRTSACGLACEPSYVACASSCAIADRGCIDACRHAHRQCARGCF